MSKGLEALKDIKNTYYDFFTLYDREQLDIIEQELKRLEEIDNGADVLVQINRYNELCDKEIALEIIKNKGIDIDLLKYHKDLEHYNFSLRGRFKHLTQEEYDLLKEVLC